MPKIAALSFLIVALFYGSLAAFSKLFYKNKSIADLSQLERNVLFDRATVKDRLILFITNSLSSFIAPPVYILAIILALILFLVT